MDELIFALNITGIEKITDDGRETHSKRYSQSGESKRGGGILTGLDLSSVGGFAGGEPQLASTPHTLSLGDVPNFVYIRNTGKLSNGDKVTDTLKIKVGGAIIARLEKGESMVLPRISNDVVIESANGYATAIKYLTVTI